MPSIADLPKHANTLAAFIKVNWALAAALVVLLTPPLYLALNAVFEKRIEVLEGHVASMQRTVDLLQQEVNDLRVYKDRSLISTTVEYSLDELYTRSPATGNDE